MHVPNIPVGSPSIKQTYHLRFEGDIKMDLKHEKMGIRT
jgi:hypothetical protein